MLIPRWTFAFSFAALFSVCTTPALANVLVVRGSSTQAYPTITAAVAASQDGDLLLVSTGTYAGFTINTRSLRIVAIPSQTVVITGLVVIQNLPLSGTIVLEGVTVRRPLLLGGGDGTALRISSCSGNVRLFHCVFEGAELQVNDENWVSGGTGVIVTNSPRLALAHCTMRGGRGSSATCDFNCSTGTGGAGLAISGSSVVVHDSQVFGGNGGLNGVLVGGYTVYADYPGAGGPGCQLTSGRLFASNVTMRGGNGAGQSSHPSGRGGDGLVVSAGALARLRSATLAGGSGGFPAPNGLPSSGAGTIQTLALPARSVDMVALAGDASTVSLSVTGFAGDNLYLEANDRAGFRFSTGSQGAWLLAHRAIMPVFKTPIFTLPGNGTFSVSVPTGNLTNVFHSETFLQARVQDSGGGSIESTPLHIVLLNHLALADCNGNGVLDLLDIAAGAGDCDGDFQPDTCQSDCNGNGVPDPCDIAHGTSADLDHNGLPDECQMAPVWVDDSAAPGGNGSMAAPFQTLSQGVNAAPFFGTVNVMDGTYTGAGNRNLDFAGKHLVVRGLNGSSACIVDAQGSTGPILRLHSGEPVGTRIEGLTLRGARLTDTDLSGLGGAAIHVSGANLVVAGCVLVDNHAESYGGAMFVSNPTGFDVRIEDCTFWANSITVSSSDLRRTGGALYFSGHVAARRNTFKQNTAPYGGAIGNVGYSFGSMISHSTLYRNIAAISGGGVFTHRSTNNGEILWLDDCLLTGNSAGQYGGAACVSSPVNSLYFPFLYVTNCTIVGNVAQQQGGALALEGGGCLNVQNSILWDSTAPQFPAIGQVNPGAHPGDLAVYGSDVQGGLASVGVTGNFDWNFNFDQDPVFVDSDGPDNNPLTFADNDLHLMPGSPCLDAGFAQFAASDLNDIDGDGITNEMVPLDLDLSPRQVDIPTVPNVNTGIDMGAFEHP